MADWNKGKGGSEPPSRELSVGLCGSAMIAVLVLAACAGPASIPDASTLAQSCNSLNGMQIPAASIGLPSGDARINSAKLIAAGSASTAPVDYCQVQGSIAALTAAADPIRFQLNLPTRWNLKALMAGGGGFNGSLVDGLAPLRDASPTQPRPLAQGYATFGTDSGHDAASYVATDPARFALNDEMFENFAHASYKKVKDVAHEVMQRYYQRRPAQQYFYGGSEGGREGLTMAQRYPQDFDGIVSVVPVIHWTGLFQGFVDLIKPQFDGGALSPAKVKTVAQAVDQTCDALDGLVDGLVNHYQGCYAKFKLDSLRCPDGRDAGDHCLSDAQLRTLRAAYEPVTLPFALANGVTQYPGRFWGGEIQFGGEGITRWLSTGKAPGMPVTANDARAVVYGSSYARYVIARDGNFDIRQYDPQRFEARVKQVSALMDSTNPDLSAFFKRGGKLIIRENTGDVAQSAAAGIAYYHSVVQALGQAQVDASLRLFMASPTSHAGQAASLTTGVQAATEHDMLSTLDAWVTRQQAPDDALLMIRQDPKAPHATLASRLMCRYPGYLQYLAGDPARAGSYRCQR